MQKICINIKHFCPKCGAILPRQVMPSPLPIKNASTKVAAPASPHKQFRKQQRTVVEIIGHSTCTRNGDHRSLGIKTGSTRNERLKSQTITRPF